MRYEAEDTAPIACDSLITLRKPQYNIDIPPLALTLAHHTLHQDELGYHTPKSSGLANHQPEPLFLSLYVQLGF